MIRQGSTPLCGQLERVQQVRAEGVAVARHVAHVVAHDPGDFGPDAAMPQLARTEYASRARVSGVVWVILRRSSFAGTRGQVACVTRG